jgi:hypothetical protein
MVNIAIAISIYFFASSFELFYFYIVHNEKRYTCGDPGCDIDPYNTFHRPVMRQNRPNTDNPEQTDRDQRCDHRFYGIAGTTAGSG